MPILQQYNNFYQHSSIFMFGSLSRKEDRMVCLSRRSDHFSKQMVSSPVWWCISGEHQHWGYSPFYRLPRHDHLSGGKMEKLNLSVSLRLTTQRGIFLQNHFLRPTLPPIYSLLFRLNWGMRTVWQHQTSFFFIWQSCCNDLMSITSPGDWEGDCDGGGGGHFIIWKVV